MRIGLSLPAGQCRFTLYDGTGMGRNLMALSALNSKIKGENILTEPDELKRALQKICSNIPYVIQRVLGKKYIDKTLVEYNKDNKDMAVPFHFVIISDFPNGLSDDICEMIEKIAASGPQAGIFTLLNMDATTEWKNKGVYNPMRLLSTTTNITILRRNNENPRGYISNIEGEKILQSFNLILGRNSIKTRFNEAVDKINKSAATVSNATVDLLHRMTEDLFWQSDASDGIKVPVGMQNATELQYFSLSVNDGESTCPYHCMIGGVPGSGKTVLIHNILCHTAWMYSPEEVQFILLYYKEGTEFKAYENLPHARVLSVQSEREFGCSVFEFINTEIERRGELFKKTGAVNIQEYNRRSTDKMPRLLVVIDEFQRLLDGDTRTANFVAGCLDDIGRRGRSFGINLILSTQSLGGVELRPATLGSIGLRIAMRLNTQHDCDKLLGSGNYMPYTGLTRPGQAVYNTLAGLTEGNVKFQTAFVSSENLQKLINIIKEKAIRRYGANLAPYKRFLYNGSAEAHISDNPDLQNFMVANERLCTIFVGEPVALSESHISFRLRRQNESNVLIVGSDESSAISLIIHSAQQILDQSTDDAKIWICDKTNVDSDWYGTCQAMADRHKNVSVYEQDSAISNIIKEIAAELQIRKDNNKPGSRIVLYLNDIYNIRPLRKSGYAPTESSQQLQTILRDGPSYGIHCFVYSPSYHGFTQIFDPHQMLSEFDIKIELRGGEGYRIFNSASDPDRMRLSPATDFIANIKIQGNSAISKFKVYQIGHS